MEGQEPVTRVSTASLTPWGPPPDRDELCPSARLGPVNGESSAKSVGDSSQGDSLPGTTTRGGTSPCSNKPSRCSDRHLASSCPHHQAAGLQRTARSPLVPHDLLRTPIEGAAREAQGQTHQVRAAIGSGEDSNTPRETPVAARGEGFLRMASREAIRGNQRTTVQEGIRHDRSSFQPDD